VIGTSSYAAACKPSALAKSLALTVVVGLGRNKKPTRSFVPMPSE